MLKSRVCEKFCCVSKPPCSVSIALPDNVLVSVNVSMLCSDVKCVVLVYSLYSVYSRFNSVLRLQRNRIEQGEVSVC